MEEEGGRMGGITGGDRGNRGIVSAGIGFLEKKTRAGRNWISEKGKKTHATLV